MITKVYSTDEERQSIIDDMEAASFVLRKDVIYPNGDKELVFQSSEESQTEIRSTTLRLAREELQATDNGLARGLEDLIDVLEKEGMTIRAKLPQELQDKLARRAELRDLLQS